MEKEKLGSRLGFILLSAGCAIGLGNVWTFPWRVGNNGGGAFVFVYILCCIILGLPVMTAEFALGRASGKTPMRMHTKLEKPGSKWHLQGWMCFAGNVLLMMFYTTIAGYFFHYLIQFLKGNTENLSWASTISNTGVNVGYMILVVALGMFVLSFDLQKGVEKVTKYMMLALFVLMIILAIHSCTMPGAKEGLLFYLKPDFSKITGKVIIAAMCQSFFSLSLGMGSMAIFGSYTNKERTLLGESANVCILDTVVALLAGFIIFPAAFTFNIGVDAGPPLLFTTMVAVFNNMDGGRIWGSLFFLFMIFAAMSTVFAVLENIQAMIRERFGWTRKKSAIIVLVGMIILCMPMALSENVLVSFDPFAEGTGFLDLWDYIVETVIQPLGSILFLVFCTFGFGWGWDKFEKEANTGKGLKIKPWMKPVFKYITPVIIAFLWIYGLVTFQYK